MKGIIFKIQRPLETNDPVEHVLIYNKDRSCEGFISMTDEIRKLFPEEPIEGVGLPHKIFVRGVINKEGVVDITHIEGWQDW